MKKIFVGVAALFLMVMVSCNGNRAAEKAREDSIRIADSIAQVEAAKAAAEQARLDSIRQDSIRQDSIQKDFENQFITPLDLVEKAGGEYTSKSGEDVKKILRSKGYKINNINESAHEWTAKKVGRNPITGVFYKSEIQVGCGARCVMWIVFANKQDAKNFYKKLDKYNSTYRVTETEFRKVWEIEGNTIDALV